MKYSFVCLFVRLTDFQNSKEIANPWEREKYMEIVINCYVCVDGENEKFEDNCIGKNDRVCETSHWILLSTKAAQLYIYNTLARYSLHHLALFTLFTMPKQNVVWDYTREHNYRLDCLSNNAIFGVGNHNTRSSDLAKATATTHTFKTTENFYLSCLN